MKIDFPSREFDDAVAAVCHGLVSDEQARALNELIRRDAAARDEYILRVELHSRLASQVDLFVPALDDEVEAAAGAGAAFPQRAATPRPPGLVTRERLIWFGGLAACLALLAAAGWKLQRSAPEQSREARPAVAVSTPESDWKPSVANLPGQEYPRINSRRQAQFRIKAPNAKNVSLYYAGSIIQPLAVTKSDDGAWTITTAPLGIGFHFYRFIIDGVNVADPATQVFRGGGGDWVSSGIEVPTGEDFHEQRNVPHGEVREQRYFSRTTEDWRRIFVYTPPDYARNTSARFPVLYLLPGRGEDESCWPTQGRMSHIIDNLIAEQKAKPMIVVMDGGVARKPGEPDAAVRSADPIRRFATLAEVFVNDLVPMIDQTYRTIDNAGYRALAGLSLGGSQAFAIALRHPERFASVGWFSGAGGQSRLGDPRTAYGGVMADAEEFNRQMRVVFLSAGADEPEGMLSVVQQNHETLRATGINHVFYASPGTGHEWHTWRRSLREFASLLFKD